MDQTMTDMPTQSASSKSAVHEGPCLTLDVTNFLLGRPSMDEVCQFFVLDALAALQPWQMSIYVVGSDSLFRIVGSFGRGPGHDVLNRYSCLDNPQLGSELRSGHPLATFPLVGMRPEQYLNISDLQDGPQVLWPLATAHRLMGVIHIRFATPPDARAVTSSLAAIAGPVSLAMDLRHGADAAAVAALPGLDAQSGDAYLHQVQQSSLVHPSMLPPLPSAAMPSRGLTVVASPDAANPPATGTRPKSDALTARQQRVLALMAKGMTNGQIARVLAFSESTVRQETMAIYRILQVKGRAEAVDVARVRGLIPTTPSGSGFGAGPGKDGS